MLPDPLFAQHGAMPGDDSWAWFALIIAAVMAFFFTFLVLVSRQYKRCPSNRILVIYGAVGRGEAVHCIHGGATFVIPLIQDYAWLSLEPMRIESSLLDALRMKNLHVDIPSVFTVAIGTTPELMQNAAIRLLGLDTVDIKKQAEDIIFGQLQQMIASMQIEDINRDRVKFLLNMQNSLELELSKVGLVLINYSGSPARLGA
jgi:flotillin